MQKLLFFMILSLGPFLVACDTEMVTVEETVTEVNIRIKNISAFDYSNVIVSNKTYGDIANDETTDYQLFDIAYQYAYVELQIDGDTFYIQPIDFVGEEPLESGSYTYEIGASEETDQAYGRLSIEAKED